MIIKGKGKAKPQHKNTVCTTNAPKLITAVNKTIDFGWYCPVAFQLGEAHYFFQPSFPFLLFLFPVLIFLSLPLFSSVILESVCQAFYLWTRVVSHPKLSQSAIFSLFFPFLARFLGTFFSRAFFVFSRADLKRLSDVARRVTWTSFIWGAEVIFAITSRCFADWRFVMCRVIHVHNDFMFSIMLYIVLLQSFRLISQNLFPFTHCVNSVQDKWGSVCNRTSGFFPNGIRQRSRDLDLKKRKKV